MTYADLGPDTDTNSGPGPHQLLLFVCAANVCRSPAMEALTVHHFRAHGAGPAWRTMSAGTHASGRQRMCVESAAALNELPGGPEFAKSHRSRPLTSDLVSRAGLILVTSRQERSVLARLAPEARARTFTMIEAALLAESAVARGISPWSEPGPATLEQLACVLHGNRGVIAQDDPAGLIGRFLFRTGRPHTIDIGDVHTGEVKHHDSVIADLRWTSEHFARALFSLLGRTT